jgi:hypothetical protein
MGNKGDVPLTLTFPSVEFAREETNPPSAEVVRVAMAVAVAVLVEADKEEDEETAAAMVGRGLMRFELWSRCVGSSWMR